MQPYKFKVERPDTLVLDQMVGVEAGREGTKKGMRTYINDTTGDRNNKHLIYLDIQKSRKTVNNAV